MKTLRCLLPALALACGSALAQTSAGYNLTEFSFDYGGDPNNGGFVASSGYHVGLDAIGGAAINAGLASSGYHLDGGFVARYPPPGEVHNQIWTGNSTMAWDPEKSIGTCSVYRDLLSVLPGGFGACLQSSLITETASDASNPPVGSGWFYVITARNVVAEEGTKGYRSNGTERANPAPCP